MGGVVFELEVGFRVGNGIVLWKSPLIIFVDKKVCEGSQCEVGGVVFETGS